jgi:hypothetical protein
MTPAEFYQQRLEQHRKSYCRNDMSLIQEAFAQFNARHDTYEEFCTHPEMGLQLFAEMLIARAEYGMHDAKRDMDLAAGILAQIKAQVVPDYGTKH